MTLANSTRWFALTAAAFTVCCLVMLYGHEQLSRSVVVTYVFMAVWGASALIAAWMAVEVVKASARTIAAKRRG